MVDRYKEIYRLNAMAKDQPLDVVTSARDEMKPIFEDMKQHAISVVESFSSKGSIGKAFSYFIGNYEGLTLFLGDPRTPWIGP